MVCEKPQIPRGIRYDKRYKPGGGSPIGPANEARVVGQDARTSPAAPEENGDHRPA